MRSLKILITLFLSPCLLSVAVQARAALEDPLTTIELETPVHFLAPDGSDLRVEAGTYAIEPAEEWIRLMAGARHDALLIEATKGTHEMELEHTMGLSVPGETEEEKDLHHVMLLLPGGQSLEATGTYSGIRHRGFLKNTFKKIKKNTTRAYKKARGTVKKAQRQVRKAAKKGMRQAKKGVQNVRKHVRKGARKARKAALHAKREVEKAARRLAAKVRKIIPKIRPLSRSEKNLAKLVFGNTIKYNMVRITNTLGAGGRPWTTNSPPLYTINVGSDYPSLMTSLERKLLLIHELAHVWQGQHLVPFMINSAAHQTLSAIHNGGDVTKAYSYTVGKRWRKYNVEQQASIVEHWFMPANRCFKNGPCGGGMKTTDSRYRYIRDHILKNKPR